MVVNNLMHVPIYRRASKTKIIGLPDLQFGVQNSKAPLLTLLALALWMIKY